MTYEKALDYLIENVTMELYDNYADWYNACKDEIQTPSLWGSPEFNRNHEQAWLDNFGSHDNPAMKGIEVEELPEPTVYEPVIEKIETSKRPISSYREPEQEYIITREPIIIEREYLPESERVIPETGRTPIITTRKYDMTPPKKESFFRRIFRNPFRRTG